MNHRDIAAHIIGSTVQASGPALSPDGTQVAFVVSRADVAANITRAAVWLAALDGSSPPRPITDGDDDHTRCGAPTGGRSPTSPRAPPTAKP